MKEENCEIIIVGAGLTGLTLAYYLNKAGKSVCLVEKSDRVGGVINTQTENGFTFETGPSTGVLSSLEIIELFDELKEDCKLQIANQGAKKRYIWKRNNWEALPSGLFSAVKTPLFSLYDKFRILGEPFRAKGGYPNEPISEMVVRRLGKSYLNYAVDPFISGVYAGDPRRLITRFALPKLYALEFEHGGFIKGTIAKHKNVEKDSRSSHKHKITREVFSFDGGLKSMINALEKNIDSNKLFLSVSELKIEQKNGAYITRFINNSGENIQISAKKIISTISADNLSDLFGFIEPDLLKDIVNTTYAPVLQVALGYKKWNGIPLDAFGGLVPGIENRKVLGVLFPSAIFPGRAPKEGAMLSVFMGGIKRTDLFQLKDTEIIQTVLSEIESMMKTVDKPDLIKIFRYQNAIAQYDIKTEKRLPAIDRIEKLYPGIIIAGSLRNGIGMSDRVKQAKEIADLILSE